MKVIDEIIPLSREHQKPLILANKIVNINKSNDLEKISQLCQDITATFLQNYKNHFAIEEEFIFLPLIKQNSPLKSICLQLQEEHYKLLDLAKNLAINNNLLTGFGALLKKHIRTEDRNLFPFLKNHLTSTQLQQIKQNYD